MSSIERLMAKKAQEQKKKALQERNNVDNTPTTGLQSKEISGGSVEPNHPDQNLGNPQTSPATELSNEHRTNPRNSEEKHTIDVSKHLHALGWPIFDNKSPISEQFRQVKRKVLNNTFGPLAKTQDNANIISITSGRPGEGKSFCSLNLALSIANEQDKTVLLIDCDVLKPTIQNQFNIEKAPGLTDYLKGETNSVSDIIFSTDIPKLKIVTAGQQLSFTSELLGSDRMLNLINELASRYPDRVIILDSPPILGINETSIIMDFCGQVLVVVEEDKTTLEQIARIEELLPEDIAKGFILNKSKSTVGGFGYGYGYGYGAERT